MISILLSISVPILFGIWLLLRREYAVRNRLLWSAGIGFAAAGLLTLTAMVNCYGSSFVLFRLTAKLPVMFAVDEISVLFAALTVTVFVCAGFFSFAYMKHETHEKRYYGFFLIVFGVLNALCFAGNLITFYLFFEMLPPRRSCKREP